MLEPFDIVKAKRQLNKVVKDHNLKLDIIVGVIINEMEIYNAILSEYNQSPAKNAKIYQTLLQMSGMIFNHLASFGGVPNKKKDNVDDSKSRLFKVLEDVGNVR